jgi:hypothetical protein
MVMDKINNLAAGLAIVLLVAFIFGVFLAWPVQLLWNLTLVPATTFLKPIGFFQAWGILVLFSILFKSDVTTKKN